MINIRRIAAKPSGLLTIILCLIIPAIACIPALSPNPPAPAGTPPPSPVSPVTSNQQPGAISGGSGTGSSENISKPQAVGGVEIVSIHYSGTLTRIGCCNPAFYERDEFVVIQNRGDTPQDINGWSLTNITKGYPTFRFPPLYPCLPYNIPSVEPNAAYQSNFSIVQNPATSVINSLSTSSNTAEPANQPAGEMDWSSCTPLEPPDQTPMKPDKGGQGKPVPCVLYPGQTILVFTDEVHCPSGGFSFNWGQGNIWNNETPDVAVLYNAEGAEVSRRSYSIGR